MRALAFLLSVLIASNVCLAQQQTPPPPPSQLDYALQPPHKIPLSERLILFRNDGQVQRGEMVVPKDELERLVSESPESLQLAQRADARLRSAELLGWLSLGALATGAILLPTGVVLASSANEANTSQRTAGAALAVAGVVMVLAWMGIGLAGVVERLNGTKDWHDAVNTYNRQVTDGQLGP
jgi:hypothetical protein